MTKEVKKSLEMTDEVKATTSNGNDEGNARSQCVKGRFSELYASFYHVADRRKCFSCQFFIGYLNENYCSHIQMRFLPNDISGF